MNKTTKNTSLLPWFLLDVFGCEQLLGGEYGVKLRM